MKASAEAPVWHSYPNNQQTKSPHKNTAWINRENVSLTREVKGCSSRSNLDHSGPLRVKLFRRAGATRLCWDKSNQNNEKVRKAYWEVWETAAVSLTWVSTKILAGNGIQLRWPKGFNEVAAYGGVGRAKGFMEERLLHRDCNSRRTSPQTEM